MKKLNSFAFLSLFAMAAFLVFSGDSIRVELSFCLPDKKSISLQEAPLPNASKKHASVSFSFLYDLKIWPQRYKKIHCLSDLHNLTPLPKSEQVNRYSHNPANNLYFCEKQKKKNNSI